MPFVQDSTGRNVVPVWINGKHTGLKPENYIEVFSSAQGKVVHLAQGITESEARQAADTAWTSFLQWKRTKPEYRRDLLLRVADLYESRAEEIAHWQVEETSCSKEFAHFNIKLAVGLIREFASALTTVFVGEIPPIQDGYGFVFKEPIGPILLIPPWNSSIILSSRGVAGALAAGCTVVMKASELCPRTHSMIVEIWEQAGLPAGCLNQVQAARKDAAVVTEALISHPGIRKVEFIGSASVGRIIGQVASKHLKPILMELGGKSPAIVLKDANLAEAAQKVAFGAFMHQGQICFSTERIIVVKEVAEQFVEHLKRQKFEPGHAVSKTISKHAHEVVAEARGQFLLGDNSFLGDASLTPTIITGIQQTDRIRDEETFGPSATLYVVENPEEAVRLANDTAYGLSATIHTKDMLQALNMARELDYGQVHVNTPTVYDEATLPVSGVKGSGWGNQNSRYGLREYLFDKTVTLHAEEADGAFGK
jgi:acyl-CoA reductase-like NAD-dependent aldehyde dehydrogenase